MKTFEKKVINTWGQTGEDWLLNLPSIVNNLSDQWLLSDLKPVKNMSYNYVALAFQKQKPVVLKISCGRQLILDEYQALKHFDGKGAVKVLAIDNKYHALLLEQAIPGHLLKDHHPHKLQDTIKIYAHLVKKLKKPLLTEGHYTHMKKWCEAIDCITDKRIEEKYVNKAKALKAWLLHSSSSHYLCHGDLHLENIIQQGNHWLAIDPKGIIGEIAFEAAAFDLVSQDEIKETASLGSKINDRVRYLSEALAIDYDGLLAWIFLRVMISVQWFIEDRGDPDAMLTLIPPIYSLLSSISEE